MGLLKKKDKDLDINNSIFLHMTDGVIAFDTSGDIVLINPAAKKLLNISPEVSHKLIEERNIAKSNKDYLLADKIRDELKNMNVVIKDTREGTIFEIIC